MSNLTSRCSQMVSTAALPGRPLPEPLLLLLASELLMVLECKVHKVTTKKMVRILPRYEFQVLIIHSSFSSAFPFFAVQCTDFKFGATAQERSRQMPTSDGKNSRERTRDVRS